MRNYDLSPLFRSTIGFDGLSRLLDTAAQGNNGANAYPPYNIEKIDDDRYRLTIAVAGFAREDLDITLTGNSLVVRGRHGEADQERTYLHRGIAGRAFERRFELAEHLKVDDAGLENGLLNIRLVREVPEELKPRSITIESRDKGVIDKAA